MTLSNIVVGIQMLTLAALSVLFWRAGQHSLAAAQLCYFLATAVLFWGKA